MAFSKEKELRRITMFVDPNDATILSRVELDGVARIVDDVTSELDADLGKWVNKSKDYDLGDNPPQAVINMIKTRLGIV